MKGKSKMKKANKKVRLKLKYKNILLFLFIFGIVIYSIIKLFTCNISNIYIVGNTYLSDWEVIKLAKLDTYPNSLKNLSFFIEKRLTKNDMIINANVSKKGLSKVYIEIEENRPLFYNSNINKTVMLDNKTLVFSSSAPFLINYIPDTIYDRFINEIKNIDQEVLNRISEIEYKPSDVDKERFFLSMSDGNYVYINIKNFSKINDYIDMLKRINGKKGLLYLDSGEYFEIK